MANGFPGTRMISFILTPVLLLAVPMVAMAASPSGEVATNSPIRREEPKPGPMGIRYFENIDKNTNMVSSRIPLPANWREATDSRQYRFEGPNRIGFSGANFRGFQFTTNRDMLQTWRMQGKRSQPPMSADQIIEQFFMPVARPLNRRLVKKYPLPALSRKTAEFQAKLFKFAPVQQDVKVWGLEWKDDKGMSYITAMTVIINRGQLMSDWSFGSQYLVAPHAEFPAAKNAFIYALTNKQINDRWIARINQRDATRAGRSAQAHNARMAAIQARGNAAKSIGDTYSEISDISHKGYLKRSNINSAAHSRTVRAISGQTVIGNHATGEHYNVPSGSNYHWVNSNGLYVGTNNPLWDPRTDNRTNGTNWTRFQGER